MFKSLFIVNRFHFFLFMASISCISQNIRKIRKKYKSDKSKPSCFKFCILWTHEISIGSLDSLCPLQTPKHTLFFFFFAHTQWIVLGSDENHYTNFAVPVFISSSPAVIWDKEMDTWQALLPPEKEMNNNPVSSNCASAKRTFPDGTLDMQHTCTHTQTYTLRGTSVCLSIYIYIHACIPKF